jgi:Cu(I)/Ag(I) efflux system membrane fusion protein
MKISIRLLVAVAVGALAGAGGTYWYGASSMESPGSASSEREPLYWVAPMDPQYRRDEPGKSPMGMDLVPVYEGGASRGEAGMVEISPQVVNNLGVRTALVETGRLQREVKTVGYVHYDENHLVSVSPRVEGWLETLHVKAAGDPVAEGEPLYTLYSPTLVNAQEELLLGIDRDNPVLIQAALERLSALDVPQAGIERLREGRGVSRTVTFAAPQSGFVDDLGVREGVYVRPGSMLMSIGQLEHLWVIGEVFERQAGLIGIGDKVGMRLDYLPGRELSGQVDYIYPTLNQDTRTVRIRVSFDNAERILKPGMFVDMTIDTDPGAPSLLIPREALIRTGAQARVVLVQGEGRFKSVAVTVGRIGDRQAEIRSGLKSGDRVVTSAQFLIDSESSKTADFQRMSLADVDQASDAHAGHDGHDGHDGMIHGSMSGLPIAQGNGQDGLGPEKQESDKGHDGHGSHESHESHMGHAGHEGHEGHEGHDDD